MNRPPRAAILLLFAMAATSASAEPRSGFVELIGRVQNWKASAEAIKTPWNNNNDQGGYGKQFRGARRRTDFVFGIMADRDAVIHTLEVKEENRRPFAFEQGETYTVYNRPVTTWNNFQCSFSVSGLSVDWAAEPTVRLIASAEANYSAFRPNKDEHPTDVCAYLIQVRPQGSDADLPPEHWPVWYVNNWIHFAHTVMPTVHYRYLANHGFNFWSWGVYDPPANLQGKPAIGVYRLVWHPETGKVTSVVLHTPGCCELVDGKDERIRYSKPPVTKATASVTQGLAPLKVDLSVTASDPDGDKLLWYAWDFDGADGIQFDAAVARVSHVFAKPGKYVVSVTAMDATGQPGRDHLRILVRE